MQSFLPLLFIFHVIYIYARSAVARQHNVAWQLNHKHNVVMSGSSSIQHPLNIADKVVNIKWQSECNIDLLRTWLLKMQYVVIVKVEYCAVLWTKEEKGIERKTKKEMIVQYYVHRRRKQGGGRPPLILVWLKVLKAGLEAKVLVNVWVIAVAPLTQTIFLRQWNRKRGPCATVQHVVLQTGERKKRFRE